MARVALCLAGEARGLIYDSELQSQVYSLLSLPATSRIELFPVLKARNAKEHELILRFLKSVPNVPIPNVATHQFPGEYLCRQCLLNSTCHASKHLCSFYFQADLLERCWKSVLMREQKIGISFDWVIRHRPDLVIAQRGVLDANVWAANVIHVNIKNRHQCFGTIKVDDQLTLVPRKFAPQYFTASNIFRSRRMLRLCKKGCDAYEFRGRLSGFGAAECYWTAWLQRHKLPLRCGGWSVKLRRQSHDKNVPSCGGLSANVQNSSYVLQIK